MAVRLACLLDGAHQVPVERKRSDNEEGLQGEDGDADQYGMAA